MKRTEEEKVFQFLEVTLGGQKYEIKPLVIRDSRVWRKQIVDFLSTTITSLPETLDVKTDEPEKFNQVLQSALVSMPDVVADLFFGYAKDLDREEIESVATDQELAEAFVLVVSVAFPLIQSLPKIVNRVYQ